MEQIFYPAEILLPDKDVDMSKWSVIACDQFTSEPEYWEDVQKLVGDAPSTLHLTLPEVYLESEQEADRLKAIRRTMDSYVDQELFTVYPDAMIYIERTDSTGKVRAGIIGALDLMQYDYHKGSRSPIRATEGTILERIPPRLRVRQNAPIELPHIMILVDDVKKTVIEKLGEQTDAMEQIYDFDLMKGGGHLKGWLLTKELQKQVLSGLKKLAEAAEKVAGAGETTIDVGKKVADTEKEVTEEGKTVADTDEEVTDEEKKVADTGKEVADSEKGVIDIEEAPLLFAVGDGNHSLATAKEYYEQLRAGHPNEDLSSHPARFALAEIVNLHSPALEFEAIHRIVTNVNTDDLFNHMTKALGLIREDSKKTLNGENNSKYAEKTGDQKNKSRDLIRQNKDRFKNNEDDTIQHMTVVLKGQEERVIITKPTSKLTLGSLQNFLDKYIEEHSEREDIKLDYIHGRDNLKALTWQANSIGFILPDMAKEELFPSVKADGALPRKTFSMGHAEDKRYYTECRRIR